MTRIVWLSILVAAVLAPFESMAANAMVENHQTAYYWKATPASESAQLLTLFCSNCGSTQSDVPLVSVLRDRLAGVYADGVPNDHLTDVWLLTYSSMTVQGGLLGAVPFFYWRIGEGSTKVPRESVKPFLDLTAPEHPVVSGLSRNLLQTMMLDPMMMPVRATSRAYQSNALDRERVHLEQAISYLRAAPTGESSDEITKGQRDLLVARFELRKRLVGGLVADRNAGRVGQQAGFDQERIRSRNWEMLRQAAEKTGLRFEPMDVAGTHGEYAVLWFSPDGAGKPQGSNLGPVWKVLNLRDPWSDARLKNWKGPYRTEDDGTRLIPLGVYGLDYPITPLLLIDFRDKLHVRRHEMTQRSINEIVSGIVGISHFTNWYFYAGAYIYDFVVARHGTATNQAERLDVYSSFRTALALDHTLEPGFRSELTRRMDSLAVNPLDGSPAREVALAEARFQVLEQEAVNGKLAEHIDGQRRAELAGYGRGQGNELFQALLHTGSLGLYTQRAKPASNNLATLKQARLTQANLELLDRLANAGGRPEIVYDPTRIQTSVKELAFSLSHATDPATRARAQHTLERLQGATEDTSLQQECASALNAINNTSKQMSIATSVRATAPLHSVTAAK